MKVEQITVFHRLDGLKHIVEADLLQRLRHLDAARAPGYGDQSGVFQLRQDPADDDGVGVDAARQEVAGDLVLILEGFDTGEDMQRDGKPTGNLHKLTSRVCFYRVAGASLRIYYTLI